MQIFQAVLQEKSRIFKGNQANLCSTCEKQKLIYGDAKEKRKKQNKIETRVKWSLERKLLENWRSFRFMGACV